MKLKTCDYDQFKFRDDNRKRIDTEHIKRLIDSIQTQNLLEMRPIIVNQHMEVLDGQHRLLAAKELKLEIYYEIREHENYMVPLLNIQKEWTTYDFLNYYSRNGFQEYTRLLNFMNHHGLNIHIALRICAGSGQHLTSKFKKGQFQFNKKVSDDSLAHCFRIVERIKQLNSDTNYVNSGKFWNGMIKLVNHENFELEKFLNNFEKLNGKLSIKATAILYYECLKDINNWKRKNIIP